MAKEDLFETPLTVGGCASAAVTLGIMWLIAQALGFSTALPDPPPRIYNNTAFRMDNGAALYRVYDPATGATCYASSVGGVFCLRSDQEESK